MCGECERTLRCIGLSESQSVVVLVMLKLAYWLTDLIDQLSGGCQHRARQGKRKSSLYYLRMLRKNLHSGGKIEAEFRLRDHFLKQSIFLFLLLSSSGNHRQQHQSSSSSAFIQRYWCDGEKEGVPYPYSMAAGAAAGLTAGWLPPPFTRQERCSRERVSLYWLLAFCMLLLLRIFDRCLIHTDPIHCRWSSVVVVIIVINVM